LKIPVAEREYIRTHWPLLAQMRQALRTEPTVRFALLFGSAARGDDTAESDIDLLVEMHDPSFERRIDLAQKLEQALAREVQVLTFDDASPNPLLLAEAAREGRVIVDREERWPTFRDNRANFERRARTLYRKRMERVFGRAPHPPAEAR